MKEKLFYILKEIFRVSIFLMVFLAVFNLGKVYGEYSDGKNFKEFFFTEKEYKYNSFNGAPAILTKQIKEYNKIDSYLNYGVFFTLLTFIFGYLSDPKNHFIDKIVKKFKGVKFQDE